MYSCNVIQLTCSPCLLLSQHQSYCRVFRCQLLSKVAPALLILKHAASVILDIMKSELRAFDSRLEQERMVLGQPKVCKLALALLHSCGNPAIKGWSWPNFWANLLSFSLGVLQQRSGIGCGVSGLSLGVDVKSLSHHPVYLLLFFIENH